MLKLNGQMIFLIRGKKVSGVLTEAKVTFNNLDYVIVGIGIDTNLNIDDFPEELKQGATSLKNEIDGEICEDKLIAIFLKRI